MDSRPGRQPLCACPSPGIMPGRYLALRTVCSDPAHWRQAAGGSAPPSIEAVTASHIYIAMDFADCERHCAAAVAAQVLLYGHASMWREGSLLIRTMASQKMKIVICSDDDNRRQ